MNKLIAALAVPAFALALGGVTTDEAQAQSQMKKRPAIAAKAKKQRVARRAPAPRVAGFMQRRGGYSYRAEDVINTSGDPRNQYGSTNSFRTWATDRQTRSGPFDHGFFFDGGGVGTRGGNSTNMN